MKKTPFVFKASTFKTWEEVFSKPGPVSVKSFVTAESIIKNKGALNLDHPDAGAITDSSRKVPVLSHWIRHREYGDYLVDTGLDSSYQTRSRGGFRGILVPLFLGKGIQAEGQDIAARIKEEGIDLKGVFFTHLHFDHIAGTLDLPKGEAVRYVAGKDEPYMLVRKGILFRSPDFLEGIEPLFEIDFSGAGEMPVLGKSVDVFGDGSLWAVATPGHTPGHLSFLVNGDAGPVLLTGDACLLKEGFDRGIGPGNYSRNVEEAQETLNKLIAFSGKYPSVRLVFGHQLPS